MPPPTARTFCGGVCFPPPPRGYALPRATAVPCCPPSPAVCCCFVLFFSFFKYKWRGEEAVLGGLLLCEEGDAVARSPSQSFRLSLGWRVSLQKKSLACMVSLAGGQLWRSLLSDPVLRLPSVSTKGEGSVGKSGACSRFHRCNGCK